MAFAEIYICSEHGETINVTRHEIIDTENDEVDCVMLCSQCYRAVRPRTVDGKPVIRPLTDEDMFWESFTGEF